MRERAERKKINLTVDFMVEADILPAESIDLSDSGIAFKTDTPIVVRMRIKDDTGKPQDRLAHLVWAKNDNNGPTTYGLKFIEEENNNQQIINTPDIPETW